MAFKVGSIFGEAILDTSKWSKGVNTIGGSLKTIGKSILQFSAVSGAALVGFFTKATIEANKFQKSISNVNTLIDGGANIADLSRELLTLDSALGSTIDLTNGLYQAISAGADPAVDAIDTVVDSAKFAKAALTDTATAVDVLTTAVNAYGKESINTTQASDLFFTTIKQGKITGDQLASTIGQSIPLFASAGISLDELGAGMAAMTKQGVSAAESTTQLNAIVNSFLKPSGKLTEALQEMGFESGAAFLETEGLTGALDLLQEATNGNASELAEFLPNVRALRGAMALTGVGGQEFTSVLEEMQNATGATQTAFEKQELTFETFANAAGKTQIILGNMAKFFVDDLAGSLTQATDSLNTFLLSQEGFNKISNVIVKISGGFMVFKEILSSVWKIAKDFTDIVLGNFVNEFKQLNAGAEQQIDTFDILAGVLQGLSFGMTVLGKLINIPITALFNLGKVAKDSLDTLIALNGFLKGELTFDEVVKNAKDAGSSLKELIVDFGTGIVDAVKTTESELAAFSSSTKMTAGSLRDTWSDTTEDTAKLVKNNYSKLVLGIENANAEIVENAGATGSELLDTQMNTQSAWSESIKKWTKEIDKKWNEVGKKIFDNVMFIVDHTVELFNSIFDTVNTGFETQLNALQVKGEEEQAELEAQKESRLLAIEDEFLQEEELLIQKRDQGLISQEEFDAQTAALEQAKADKTVQVEKEMDAKIQANKNEQKKKENAIKKKQFEADKANQIANIWIQYALGLVGLWSQSLSQFGPIAGSIIAGVMTAALTGIAIANTVLVSQQQFIPARESGGMASGLTRINEAGGEIVTLPDGSQVIPNDISSQIARNSGRMGNTYNVSFAGANIDSNMSLRKVTDHVLGELDRMIRSET